MQELARSLESWQIAALLVLFAIIAGALTTELAQRWQLPKPMITAGVAVVAQAV